MTLQKPLAREVRSLTEAGIMYSFCTMVTNLGEYEAMIAAFSRQGFTERDCEFLYIDNSSENRFDAYAGYNLFLQEARGRYIILCHQDILPGGDDRPKLTTLLAELTQHDPAWGLCGNAGTRASGTNAVRITDPNGTDIAEGGPFPARVISLDENFIVVRRQANLATSRDLSGFHWYGSDLCIVADALGWRAYVIDFHLVHKSGGNPDASFTAAGAALRRKYSRAFRPRRQHVVTGRSVFVSASRMETLVRQALWSARQMLARVSHRLRRSGS